MHKELNFFNNIAQKLVVSSDDSTLGRIKNIANLNQEITIFNNGRDPILVTIMFVFLQTEDTITIL